MRHPIPFPFLMSMHPLELREAYDDLEEQLMSGMVRDRPHAVEETMNRIQWVLGEQPFGLVGFQDHEQMMYENEWGGMGPGMAMHPDMHPRMHPRARHEPIGAESWYGHGSRRQGPSRRRYRPRDAPPEMRSRYDPGRYSREDQEDRSPSRSTNSMSSESADEEGSDVNNNDEIPRGAAPGSRGPGPERADPVPLDPFASPGENRQYRSSPFGEHHPPRPGPSYGAEFGNSPFDRPASAPKKDLYAILEVSKNATKDEMEASYRKLRIKHHPDKAAGQGEAAVKQANDKMAEINEAWDWLRHDEKRKCYDETGGCSENDFENWQEMKRMEENFRGGFAGMYARGGSWGFGGGRGRGPWRGMNAGRYGGMGGGRGAFHRGGRFGGYY